MPKRERRIIDKVFILLGSAMTLVLIAAGCLGLAASHFATRTVHDELASQKIYFPPKGSAALNPQEFPGLQQYAGQLVDNGPKAKAFADEFIAVHLSKVANGQTYSEVSAAAQADPSNAKLKQEEQTLFQGQTLRGMLLGDGYSYWTMGQLAGYAAIAAFVGAAVMAVLVLLGLRHLQQAR